MEKTLNISEAAEILGTTPETLRRWDKSGKFQPSARHPMNNYRIYSIEQVHELKEQIEFYFALPTPKVHKEVRKETAPFFETNLGSLFLLDAIKFLKSFDDESVDLIFADPPYNIKKAQWDSFKSQQKYVEWCLEWIKECKRVLTTTGTLYICGFSEILADVKWAASSIFEGCKWLVWFYRNKANMSNDWGRSHESLLHFRKSKKFTFNVDEVRLPYNAHTLKYPEHPQAETSQYGNGKEYNWKPHPKGARPKDVFELPTIANNAWEKRSHETQKPVALLKKCVLGSSNEGDMVVDPFGGSGTTYAVAEAFGRRWAGSENNPIYCEVIRDRLLDGDHITRIRDGEDDKKSEKLRAKLRNL